MNSPTNAAAQARRPRLGPFPLWLIGLAILVGALLAALVLRHELGERSVVVLSLVALQGLFLLIAGAGRRYLTWSVLVLAFIVGLSSIVASVLLYVEWQRTVSDIRAEPGRLAEMLASIENVRLAYEGSVHPSEQESLQTQIAASIERANRESAAALAELAAEERGRRQSFILCLVIALVLSASVVGYYRLYLRARRAPSRESKR